jgi:hypothetical protein
LASRIRVAMTAAGRPARLAALPSSRRSACAQFKIWVAFILVGFVAALAQLLQGDLDIFARVLNGLFDSAKTGFDISLGLVGVMSLWLGIMKVGERAA